MTEEEALELKPGDVVIYKGTRGVVYEAGRYQHSQTVYVKVDYPDKPTGLWTTSERYEHSLSISLLRKAVLIEGFEL